MKILVETSARHIHLSQHDFEILFGKNAKLTIRKSLSQPGQFACNERVSIIGPKNKIQSVPILGPLRNQTQVEISLTDARKLGLNVLIRDSGNLAGTSGCTLVGPMGELNISDGVIAAKRHIHIDPKSAENFNLKDEQYVKVKIYSEHRSLIFDDVVVRVNENFSPAMHIDTDEANAAGINSNVYGEIIL